MKHRIIALSTLITSAIFASCTGNNTAKNPPDTANNTANTPRSTDTSKITTTTGDAPNVDNSGSGGTKIDTPKTK